MEGHHDGTLKHSPGRIGLQTRQPMRVDKGLAFAMMGSSICMYVFSTYMIIRSALHKGDVCLLGRHTSYMTTFAETHARGSFGQGGSILDFPKLSICRAFMSFAMGEEARPNLHAEDL